MRRARRLATGIFVTPSAPDSDNPNVDTDGDLGRARPLKMTPWTRRERVLIASTGIVAGLIALLVVEAVDAPSLAPTDNLPSGGPGGWVIAAAIVLGVIIGSFAVRLRRRPRSTGLG